MLMGPRNLFDSDQNLSLHQNNASKCKMLTWRKRGNLLYRYVPENQQRQRQDQQFEGEENFDYHVDRKTGWRCYREPRETRRQHLNLQHRSGKTNSGRRFWISWRPYHLIVVVISVSWKEFQKIDPCVERTPTPKTHLCSTLSSQRAPNN